MAKNEEEEQQYYCNVTLTPEVVIVFSGPVSDIREKLKFLYNSVNYPETIYSNDKDGQDYELKQAVVVFTEADNDCDGLQRCFSLRNYKYELETIKG